MKTFFVFALLCLCTTFAAAGTISVEPAGSCAGDLNAIQTAVNSAQPGDVVELAPGSYDFSCVTADAAGVFIGNPDITVQGTAGQTLISGPGFANHTVSTGFFVGADAVTLDSLSLSGFATAVHAGGGQSPANHIAITNSIFENNIQAVFVAQNTLAPLMVGNQFFVPAPPDSDIFAQFGVTFAVVVSRHCSEFLFAKNTITGPGFTVHFQNTDELVEDPHITNEGLHTIGLFQADFQGDTAELGRISDNVITGLDDGMQASSNLGVITRNVVIHNAIGIVLSNDFDDGVHQVSGNVITENVATDNQVGIWMASATANTIALNDLRNNSLAGLLFLGNPGGAPSTGNLFHQNQGAKIVGAQGNSSF
jgi:parallel beta-helix repeat protein